MTNSQVIEGQGQGRGHGSGEFGRSDIDRGQFFYFSFTLICSRILLACVNLSLFMFYVRVMGFPKRTVILPGFPDEMFLNCMLIVDAASACHG